MEKNERLKIKIAAVSCTTLIEVFKSGTLPLLLLPILVIQTRQRMMTSELADSMAKGSLEEYFSLGKEFIEL